LTGFSDSATEVLYSIIKSRPQATLAAVTIAAPAKWAAAVELCDAAASVDNPAITAISSSLSNADNPILVDPDKIMSSIRSAISTAQDPIAPKSTAFLFHLRDLGLLEAKAKHDPKASKCSTFSHEFVLLFSSAGMTVLQGHSNIGDRNSMRQWLEEDHGEPLDWDKAE
jgi:hypothetical protein